MELQFILFEVSYVLKQSIKAGVSLQGYGPHSRD